MLDLLFAPVCFGCGAFLRPPVGALGACPRCTVEITALPTGDVRRGDIIALFEYEGILARALARLKYQRQLALAGPLGAALARGLAEIECDVFTPVPLHPMRLLARGFNQSDLLLRQGLARVRPPRPETVDLLVRRRLTPAQASLAAAQRLGNVRGAFAVARRRAPRVEGRSVCVVDDVTTTGATLKACIEALRAAGAQRVVGLALMRTLA